MKRIILYIIVCSAIFSSCKKESNPITPGPATPSTPILASPVNNSEAEFMPVTFNWNIDSVVLSYELQVSTDINFNSFVFNQDSIITSSQTVTSLNPLNQYYWRVRATNDNGTSNWTTPVWTFITASGAETGTSCPGLPIITYLGRIYHTVQIGSQCWLKENLDVGTMITGTQSQTNNNIIEKYCYSNDTTICKIYGGLYQWDEAMQYSSSGANVQGICPTGWHIPDTTEFNNLGATENNQGNELKAIGQGRGNGAGTDASGFSALMSGYRGHEGIFYDIGDYTNFWSSEERDTTAGVMWLGFDSRSINPSYSVKIVGFSVRCIKD